MSLITGDRSTAALQTLIDQGIVVHAKPDYAIPTLPVDLPKLDDESLMLLYSKLTAYADFIGVQVAAAQIDERNAEKMLSMLESRKMAASSGSSENKVTFARAQVASDPAVVEQKEVCEQTYAYRKVIEVMMTNIERDAALVSRELTRRTSSVNNRSSKWTA